MYFHEVEYQEHNPLNRQERYLFAESFDVLKKCLIGELYARPFIRLPFTSTITLVSDDCIQWRRHEDRLNDDIIGLVYIIAEDKVPYNEYIVMLEPES